MVASSSLFLCWTTFFMLPKLWLKRKASLTDFVLLSTTVVVLVNLSIICSYISWVEDG
ncbi:hypothetical protein NC652_030131 [Populus alba x Populus x berolinensis]|nr:hypothetical protein NC652_030131 [Populus alba x Populus x berolinensis]